MKVRCYWEHIGSNKKFKNPRTSNLPQKKKQDRINISKTWETCWEFIGNIMGTTNLKNPRTSPFLVRYLNDMG
jgi:hypothetical protein